MLRVTVELIPHSGGQKRVLAVGEIANIGGGLETGEYDARFYGGVPFQDYRTFGPDDLISTGKVREYPRKTNNLWKLIGQALSAAGLT